MAVHHRSLRLLQNAVFLASPALYGPLNLSYSHCEHLHASCRRWMHWGLPHVLGAATPHSQAVLGSSGHMEGQHNPPNAHTPTVQCLTAGVNLQRRFMAIRRKRRGAATPQRAPLQKLSRPVDGAIDAATVRLVEGDSHRIVSKAEAITLAREQGLNLVQLDQQEAQPVCRILDYSRMQQVYSDVAEKKASKALEAEVQSSRMKAIRVGCAPWPAQATLSNAKASATCACLCYVVLPSGCTEYNLCKSPTDSDKTCVLTCGQTIRLHMHKAATERSNRCS